MSRFLDPYTGPHLRVGIPHTIRIYRGLQFGRMYNTLYSQCHTMGKVHTPSNLREYILWDNYIVMSTQSWPLSWFQLWRRTHRYVSLDIYRRNSVCHDISLMERLPIQHNIYQLLICCKVQHIAITFQFLKTGGIFVHMCY